MNRSTPPSTIVRKTPLPPYLHLRLWVLLGTVPAGHGAEAPGNQFELADLSLEQLVDIEITSVSKKETSLFRSPAAIAVVTNDDLRRLGPTSFPEALRGVPGLSVGRVDHNIWAVGARGFSHQYTDKLLVLQDGRSIYTPAFAGVFWDAHDAVLEDIERIEVIRGPGATLWGANAVMGVINVISKSAVETQGGLISAGAGPGEGNEVSVRYGGRAGPDLFYRVYAKHFDRDPMADITGADLSQDWEALRGGFRLDWVPTEHDVVTLQADAVTSEVSETIHDYFYGPPYVALTPVVSESQSTNLLGRWTRTFTDESQLSIQSYVDTGWHAGLGTREDRDTFDLEVQHRFRWAELHEIVGGAGYRTSSDNILPASYVHWVPQKETLHLASAFLQDEITLVPDRLTVTIGSKFEHNNVTGLEIQPGVRALWTPSEMQTIWGAVARATRTPSRLNLHGHGIVGFQELMPGMPPGIVTMRGNPELRSEVLYSYELGYRVELARRVSFDLAAFYNDHARMITFAAAPPEFVLEPVPHMALPVDWVTVSGSRALGGEATIQCLLTDSWRLTANYAIQDVRMPGVGVPDTTLTAQQAGLRSFVDLPFHLEWTTAMTWVSAMPSPVPGSSDLPSHLRLDLGVTWRANDALELGLWGRDLLEDEHHLEAIGLTTAQPAAAGRSFFARATWRF